MPFIDLFQIKMKIYAMYLLRIPDAWKIKKYLR